MRDITIKIVGKQVYDDREEDQLEFITDGKLYQRGDAIYMVYEETELSGLEGYKTTLKLTADSLKMKRIGKAGMGSELFFQKDRRFSSTYNTPYGPVDMEVLTRSVENRLDPKTLLGAIEISYDISMDGVSEGKNRIEINVM
jgi:uncharacterized beta-barrel protein YwiB (DUF1934 family)